MSLRAALSPAEALLAGTAYPKARSMQRKIIYHAGETDSLRRAFDSASASPSTVPHLPSSPPSPLQPYAAAHNNAPRAPAGPTNSGKTHNALQRLQTAESGVYCGPLRLLAMEARVRKPLPSPAHVKHNLRGKRG